MYHWIRDCQIWDRGGSDNGGFLEALWFFYHFLRVAGWKNIWEMDGYDNHVQDGDMEEVGITNWTSYLNGTISKDTANKNMGYQGLKVISTEASSGVRSADFINMQATGSTYRLRFWVLNNTGRTWDVEVNTPTGGAVVVGTISSSPSWQEVEFSFTSDSTLTTGHWARITDPSWSSVDGTIYVDSMFVYRPFFEGRVQQDFAGTSDGTITNPDQFSSGTYSFSAATDVGRYIAVWDPTNLGNSGIYRITNAVGGVATLNLRAGGSPALATQAGLSWRMIDTVDSPYQWDPGITEYQYCGFGLESPHAEKWRIFFRANWNTGGDYTWINLWASPYDADFYVDDGLIYDYDVSTQDTKAKYAKGGSTLTTFCMRGRNPSIRDATNLRLYLMTDTEGSFIFPIIRDNDGAHPNSIAGGFVGFTGVDSYHTLRESFCCFFPSDVDVEGSDDIGFTDSGLQFSAHGAQCGDVGKGWMTRSTIMSMGYGGAANDELDYTAVNFRVNPYDSKWWFRKPKIARDYVGSLTNNPTEKEMDGVGQFHGPTTDVLLTKDSNSYFQIGAGWYWEWWSGHEPLP